jgi:glyceraldehyde 3-phosphate dehydrogenase
MIPTTTGAAKAIGLVVPALAGRLDGIAVRVPVEDGSLVDLVVELEKKTTVEKVNGILQKAASGNMKRYLQFSEDPIVSYDVIGNSHSSVVDGLSTAILDSGLLKVLSWYDNEWGYACRIVDMIKIAMGEPVNAQEEMVLSG